MCGTGLWPARDTAQATSVLSDVVRTSMAAQTIVVTRTIPLHPGHPERICWGCEHFCPADAMRCGNGTDRAQHPVELWGEDWTEFEPGTQEGTPLTPRSV